MTKGNKKLHKFRVSEQRLENVLEIHKIFGIIIIQTDHLTNNNKKNLRH